MPRIARFTIDSIADLTRQLRFAPAETRAKQMDAAEEFAAEIEPDQLYPEDFVIFRITGYRPQQMDNPAILVGEALLGDLANFIQLLSDGLQLPPDYRGRRALAMDEVAKRLNVASKTLQRYRKRGLVCHYVLFGEDDQRLACFDDSLARFINDHETQIKKARNFSRVDRSVTASIIEEARELREQRRLSLNEAALILAKKHDRAHETIRLLLRRYDRRSPEPIFTERGPLTERDGRILHRAWRWGVPVSVMAERYGRTPTTIHRSINRRRGFLLRSVDLRFVELPTFAREDAAEVILAVPAVREGLDRLLPRHDALALIEAAKDFSADDEAEIALLGAYNFLKRRAAAGVANLGDWPGATALDAIETDLRWAGLIKRRLVCIGLPAALGRIEQNLHHTLHEQPAERIVAAIRTAVSIASNVVEAIDPSKGHRLSRLVAYAADKALARDSSLVESPGRAAARHAGSAIQLADPLVSLVRWDRFLSLPGRMISCANQLDAPLRSLLEERYGSGSNPPQTISRIAGFRGTNATVIARRLAQIDRILRGYNRRPDDHAE